MEMTTTPQEKVRKAKMSEARLAIRIPSELHDQFLEAARMQHEQISTVVRDFAQQYIAKARQQQEQHA